MAGSGPNWDAAEDVVKSCLWRNPSFSFAVGTIESQGPEREGQACGVPPSDFVSRPCWGSRQVPMLVGREAALLGRGVTGLLGREILGQAGRGARSAAPGPEPEPWNLTGEEQLSQGGWRESLDTSS